MVATDVRSSTASQDSAMRKEELAAMYNPVQASFGVILTILAVVVPNFVLWYGFSAVGPSAGLKVFQLVSPTQISILGDATLSAAFLLFALLYVFNWPEFGRLCKIITISVPWAILALGSVMKGRRYPYFPMLVTLFHIGLFLGVLRLTVCREGKLSRGTFYWTISAAAFVSAVVLGTAFSMWKWRDGNDWDDSTREWMAAEMEDLYKNILSTRELSYAQHCGPNADISQESVEDRVMIKGGCTSANTVLFLVWACTFGGCFANLVIWAFTLIAGMPMKTRDHTLDHELERFVKKFLFCIVMIAMGLYASSYFNGVSVKLSGVLAAFLLMFLIMLLAWMNLEFGQQQIYVKFKDMQEETKKKLSFIPPWTINVAKAVLVWAFNILIPMAVVLDVLRQKVRRALGYAKEGEGSLSPEGRQIVTMLQPWNWSNALWWVCALGEFYFIFQFGFAKITTVFLSWMNSTFEEQSVSFGIVITINFVVGALMFLAPPVPGIAVYLFTGIVVGLTASNDQNKDTIGFGLGCVIAIVLCFFLKMAACCGQYAMGYFMGKSVKIQALIGVDKVPTRAMQKILCRRGLDMGKVAILVGGPDWPISVTCGIIRLNVAQMLLGTAPVIALIAPTVLAGAFIGQVTPGEDSSLNLYATVLTGVASLLQVCSGLIAVYYIATVATIHREELAQPREEHAAVERLAQEEAEYNQVFAEATNWRNLPTFHKALLLVATGFIMVSCPIFFFCETCFQNFCINCEIKKPLDENGLDGDVFNLIERPNGVIALILFFAGAFFHVVYIKATERLAMSALRERKTGGPPTHNAGPLKVDDQQTAKPLAQVIGTPQ
jgi:hypothetical protein